MPAHQELSPKLCNGTDREITASKLARVAEPLYGTIGAVAIGAVAVLAVYKAWSVSSLPAAPAIHSHKPID